MQVKLRKVGGSLVMAIPASIRRELNLEEGSVLEVANAAGVVTATPAIRRHRIGLAARIAMCDLTEPIGAGREAEDRMWEGTPPAGREEV